MREIESKHQLARLALAWMVICPWGGAPFLAGAEVDFARDVHPILVKHCFGCHGAEKQKSDLRLDSREAVLQGGKQGRAVIPGDSEASLLVSAIRRQGDLEMPPDGPLTELEVHLLTEWVRQGAPWPNAMPRVRDGRPQSLDAPVLTDNLTGSLIKRFCIDCHDADRHEGDMNFETLDPAHPASDPQAWEKVILKLDHRHMPPAGKARPDETTYDQVLLALKSAIDQAAEAHPNPGRTDTFRRLTRFEYQNAIRDLLGLDVDVATLLPKDEVSQGFDNITVGGLSPTLMERYLTAAGKISKLAIGRAKALSQSAIYTVPLDLTQERHIDGLPLGTRGGAVFAHHFPVDGEYDIQLNLTRDRDGFVEGFRRRRQSHEMVLLLDDAAIGSFTINPPPKDHSHDDLDKHLTVRLRVPAGRHRIAAAFKGPSTALREGERQPYLASFNSFRHPRTKPALYSINVFGPFGEVQPGSTLSRQKVFSQYPNSPEEEEFVAQAIIGRLMRQAYRRSISDQDLERPLSFYREERQAHGFEAGIEMALRAILASPQFIFRIEADPPAVGSGEVYRVSDTELASRLSFFLWSSIPDEALLDAAMNGELSNPNTLKAQVSRMLREEKSKSLISNFASQWLHLRNIDAAKPDARTFIDFDQNIRSAMRRETELLIEHILREDRSVLEFLRADYTFLNERLAKHYGIPNVYGSRFRRVSLQDVPTRGGLLTHGSILTVTSHALRTSPVLRGQWVLSSILGTPAKPPPPNVPQLQEETQSVTEELASLRERLAEHRRKAACAACHNMMDPLGLALENYDAVGRWRVREGGLSIDASGKMPDGTEFKGALALQGVILRRPELFVITITEKLLTYALGRGVEYYDRPAIRKITSQSKSDEYSLSSIVLGIVQSQPFQYKTTL